MSTINLQENIIFIHIPKTAGTSIEAVDWVGYNFKQHGSIQDIVNLNIPEYNLDSFIKFTFVRHPYTRFISGVLNHTYKGEDPTVDVIRECILEKDYENQATLKPQHTFIELDGEPKIDFIGKYEYLQRDFDIFCTLVDKTITKLGWENKGVKVDYDRLLTKDIKEFVESYYERDFELFDYGRY